MSDIFEKIESLERELQKAREEKNRIESLPPAFRLAELLHERLCHQNHTDACGWDYGSWEKSKSDMTREAYLKKANTILDITDFDTAIKIARTL